MVSGEAPVMDDRENKWRHIWLVVPILVILAVLGSVYASSNSKPLYDPSRVVFYKGHLYANFKPAQAVHGTGEHMTGTPVPFDTLWGPPIRATEFVADDGMTYGDCIGAVYPGDSFNPWVDQPYSEIICRKLS